MKNLVVLGAGTAGTTVANRIRKALDPLEWRITIVDQEPSHYYQPGFLFIPFGIYDPKDVIKPKRDLLPTDVEWIEAQIELILPERNQVKLENGQIINYDFLVIATGSRIDPQATPGLLGDEWQRTIYDYYTLEGAQALRRHLSTWRGGRLVLNVVDYPIKCPVAPLEFLLIADWYFQMKGIREQVEIVFATPLLGAFNQRMAARYLGGMLETKRINVVPEFFVERVDPGGKKIISYDDTVLDYDLLITVPLNRGDAVVHRSGLGDALDFVPVDKHTFVHPKYSNLFVLGDAVALPAAKSGSTAHYMADCFVKNFLRHIAGQPPEILFDGHSTCFFESGFNRAVAIDFNYVVEPLPGSYPWPGIGPFRLLKETRLNHTGRMLLRWMYWSFLIKGNNLGFPSLMSMKGKRYADYKGA